MVDNMEWFNVFGLIFIAVIMIPNVVFAIKCKDGFDNKWNNKYVEVTEQVGRLGCFGFMIINIPGTWFGWWSDEAFALYLIGGCKNSCVYGKQIFLIRNRYVKLCCRINDYAAVEYIFVLTVLPCRKIIYIIFDFFA